jgi:hypothetical protein
MSSSEPGTGATGEAQGFAIPAGLCRRCVRSLSRRLRDVPGVVAFEVDVGRSRVRVAGDVRADDVRAVIARSHGP